MIIGQYEARVGEKHRVAFPKKFRDVLGDRLVLTKGLEYNLIAVSEENWHTLLEGTEGKPFIDKSTRELQRFLLGNATEIEMDAQGRFVIPEYLREYAQIGSNVVFAGIKRYVEVWDKTQWIEQQQQLSENIESIAKRLSDQTNGQE